MIALILIISVFGTPLVVKKKVQQKKQEKKLDDAAKDAANKMNDMLGK